MAIQALRLSQLLAADSFRMVHTRPAPLWDYRWAASSSDPRVSLLIAIKGYGERGEALSAWAGISIGSGWAYIKGLTETDLLEGLPYGVADRGYSLVDTDDKARVWEHRVAEAGPRRTAQVYERVASQLLKSTADAIVSVERYLGFIDPAQPATEVIAQLRATAGALGADQATALAEAPGVLQETGLEAVYQLAALLLVCYHRTVEPNLDLRLQGVVPMPAEGTMWRLQLLADRLRSRE